MEQTLIHPNWHVLLIHYPLALLVIGVLIELFSFMWRRHGFRAAGRWMILLGALSAVPAAFSGIYALNDVATMNNPAAESPWHVKVASTPLSQHAWEMLTDHVWLQVIATAIFLSVVLVWIASCDDWRRKLHGPMLVLLVIGMGFVAWGAWEGGEAVYRHGVGVNPVTAVNAPGIHPAGEESRVLAEAEPQSGAMRTFLAILAPEQAHVTMAGFLVALALVSLALSARAMGGTSATVIETTAVIPADQARPVSDADARAALLRDDATVISRERTIIPAPVVPSGRFWLLTFIVALLVLLGGVAVLGLESERWAPKQLGEMIAAQPRMLAHAITGGSIVLLTLCLAVAARWAKQNRMVLGILAALLLIALGIQLWMGILMLYDTPQGPLTRFNPAPAPTTQPAS